MSYVLSIGEAGKGRMVANDMEIGDIAIISDSARREECGDVILRSCAGWIDLNNPIKTWSGSCSLEVTPIMSGTKITLEVE